MAAKKTTPKKKTVKKKTTKKKATGKRAAAASKPAASAGQAKPKASAGKKAAGAAKGKVRAADVNLGHILALRPRVNASFAPERLRRAKDFLSEETYASLPEAARAVAEKALDTARKPRPGRPRKGKG